MSLDYWRNTERTVTLSFENGQYLLVGEWGGWDGETRHYCLSKQDIVTLQKSLEFLLREEHGS